MRTTYVVAGWFIALAFAFLDGGVDGWSLHTRLTLVGCVMEIVGITLLAADVVTEPGRLALQRTWAAIRGVSLTVWTIGRRRPSSHHVRATASVGIDVSGHLTAQKIPPTLQGQVDELRKELGALDQRMADAERDLRKEIEQTRHALEKSMADLIAEERTVLRPQRLAGFVIALLGSTVLAAANLL